MSTQLLMNERIRGALVRLVADDGSQIGIFPVREALSRARSTNLDLVQVAPGDPPVCRILDGGKYLFERKKAEREQARRQREMTVDIKEIQLRPTINDNDLLIKARKALEFLSDGDKVKVVLRFRGREQSHKNEGRKVIDRFLESVVDYKIDRPVSDQGRDMIFVLAPVKTKAELLNEGKNSALAAARRDPG